MLRCCPWVPSLTPDAKPGSQQGSVHPSGTTVLPSVLVPLEALPSARGCDVAVGPGLGSGEAAADPAHHCGRVPLPKPLGRPVAASPELSGTW